MPPNPGLSSSCLPMPTEQHHRPGTESPTTIATTESPPPPPPPAVPSSSQSDSCLVGAVAGGRRRRHPSCCSSRRRPDPAAAVSASAAHPCPCWRCCQFVSGHCCWWHCPSSCSGCRTRHAVSSSSCCRRRSVRRRPTDSPSGSVVLPDGLAVGPPWPAAAAAAAAADAAAGPFAASGRTPPTAACVSCVCAQSVAVPEAVARPARLLQLPLYFLCATYISMVGMVGWSDAVRDREAGS